MKLKDGLFLLPFLNDEVLSPTLEPSALILIKVRRSMYIHVHMYYVRIEEGLHL